MTEKFDVLRGREATAVLENEAFKAAMQGMKDAVIQNWKECPVAGAAGFAVADATDLTALTALPGAALLAAVLPGLAFDVRVMPCSPCCMWRNDSASRAALPLSPP